MWVVRVGVGAYTSTARGASKRAGNGNRFKGLVCMPQETGCVLLIILLGHRLAVVQGRSFGLDGACHRQDMVILWPSSRLELPVTWHILAACDGLY